MVLIRRVKISLYFKYGENTEAIGKPGAEWLRNAVSRVLGLKNNSINMLAFDRSVFFNEDPKTHKGRNSYPLVLFHHLNHSFFLTGLNEGAQMLEKMFQECNKPVQLDSKTMIHFDLQAEEQHDIRTSVKRQSYFIRQWIPFKQAEYDAMITNVSDIKGKISNLEERIQLQIIKDLSNHLKLQLKTPEIRITDIDILVGKRVSYEAHEYFGFSPVFNTNLLLPDYIGLGHGKAFGFGIIQRVANVKPVE